MTALPEDDRTREPAIARPEDPALMHMAVVGDTYTVLLSGEQTAGRFAILDMLIPPGGGPPPHRHNFEECFRVLEGSLEVWVRDLPPVRLEAGDTANIPANAPTRSTTRRRFRHGCCAPPPPRAWKSSSPSSATPYPRAPRRARRSVTPSAQTGYAAP
jgi:quercetin dioxygenase-like cupin family protein